MAIQDVLFSKSAQMLEAERIFRQAEDDLMTVSAEEIKESPISAERTSKRNKLLLSYIRVLQSMIEQNREQNLLVTIISAGVIVSILRGPDAVVWLFKLLHIL